MPRSAALVFAAAVLVASAALAAWVLRPPPVSEPAPVAAEDPATATTLGDIERRLQRLERDVFQPRLAARDPSKRISDLERRIGVLESSRRSPPSSATVSASGGAATAETAPPAATETSAGIDAGSLADADLLVQARALSSRQDQGSALPYWQEVLARGPSDEVFVEAQLQVGYGYRVAKDFARAEAAFRDAIRVAGEATERGQFATFQLAWSRHFQGDDAAAADTMIAVAQHPATSRVLTGHARLNGAHFALTVNDSRRAREALEGIVRDFGGSNVPIEAWLAEEAGSRLERLK